MVLKLRKALGLSQKEFGASLGISQKHVSQIEKETREPSEQLIKHLCLRFNTSENWIKKGEGEMFISPEDAIKQQMARFGERTIVEAFKNIMKENSLAMAAGRHSHRADTGDPDLDRLINSLYDLWAVGDERLKTWASVQFDIAIPKHVIEEAQKKQKETYGQASAG